MKHLCTHCGQDCQSKLYRARTHRELQGYKKGQEALKRKIAEHCTVENHTKLAKEKLIGYCPYCKKKTF